MKKVYKVSYYLLELCVKMAIMLLTFSLLKLLFFWIHRSLFLLSSFSDGLSIFYHALRFDLSALCYVNLVLIISYLVPLPQRRLYWYQQIQRWIFVTFNGFAIFFELIDIAYFPYVLRRSNAGDLALAGNTSDLLPLFLREYWYLLLLFVILLLFLHWAFKKITLPSPPKEQFLLLQLVVMIIAGGFTFIGLRGGIQLRPLMPLNAQQYVPDMQLAPLVYPTTLSLIFSTQQRFIKEKEYFSDQEVNELFPIHRKNQQKPRSTNKENVVVIILESFGQEYSSFLAKDKNGYMTFLDSLIQESLYYEYSFANGMRSTQGIAAITASIPALMEDPYLFSAYQSNQLDGIPQLLKEEGYTSAFFHGANEGSMEFEDFANLCGFDYYFDRRHFGNDAFYDGHWGIWDRPFFQYTAKTLDTFPEPFYAQLFSLSSHHPYKIEPFYEALQPESMPMYRSIRYTDDALRRFFKTASTMDWFDNTLFIITADHTGFSRVHKYQTRPGRYMIPMLLFKPKGSLKGRKRGVTQQIDILPTVMDYLNYDHPYTSFGMSMLDTTSQRYAYMYFNQLYQIMDERFVLLFDGENSIGMYDFIEDIGMHKDLINQFHEDRIRLEKQLKAVIQQHHNGLIRNELGAKR